MAVLLPPMITHGWLIIELLDQTDEIEDAALSRPGIWLYRPRTHPQHQVLPGMFRPRHDACGIEDPSRARRERTRRQAAPWSASS